MLRLAGLDAYPVLMDTGPRKDVEVPIVSFSHAIVCVQDVDGSYQLMDCTDENTKDLLPSYLCNRSYLIAHPEGKTLQTSPIVPADEHMVHIETCGQIDARGNMAAQTELRFDRTANLFGRTPVGNGRGKLRWHVLRRKPTEFSTGCAGIVIL